MLTGRRRPRCRARGNSRPEELADASSSADPLFRVCGSSLFVAQEPQIPQAREASLRHTCSLARTKATLRRSNRKVDQPGFAVQ